MPTHPLLALARTMGNPVLQDEIATFVWQGKTAVRLIEDVHNWDDSPQKMLRAGSELWLYSMVLPKDSYIEYAFVDPNTNERIPDPLNPRKVWNGANAYNHYFYMPDAKPSPYVLPMKGVEAGKVSKHAVVTRDFAAGKTRIVHLYQPPVTIPVPLLVIYDGSDYLHRGKLNIIVDNLLAMKRIQPFAMALVNNGGAARSIEYSCGEATLGFITECVLPLAKEQLELEPIEAGGYGIMGASLSGSMALFTALRLPQIFHKVLSQSGAFISPEYQSVVVDLVRYTPRPGIKIWMDAGRMEWLLEGNRQMYQLLKGKKYPVTYREHSDGHNYTAWRNNVWRGLQSLYK